LIQRKPLLPYQLNLLKWYGDVLSSLCALKRVEDALSRSERRFRAIFEGANVGIAVIDRAGYLMVCNPTCHQIFGYSAHELRYRAFSDLLDPDSRVGYLESFAQLLRGEIASFQFEKQGIRRGGEKIWVNINMSIFPSPAAQNSYIVAYVEDITERKWNEKRTQELILEREQVKLLTEFVQTISHDLRTPLAIINTSLYLLERASDSEKKQYYSNKISDQVLRVSSLVDGLLGMVKWDSHASYTLEEVDVNALISSVGVDMGTLAAEKSLTLKFDLGANIPKLTADWFALGEALTNIVKNAVQYTPAEGSVVVRSRAHSSHAVIEVQDTGIGIEAQDLRHIFDRLYRADKARSTHGIGLGLPIARKIVEAHGGRIEVESTPGKGSLFRMVLPYKPEGILL
jgi:two-component system phosphate regulon sensor histidine kinase PhoR